MFYANTVTMFTVQNSRSLKCLPTRSAALSATVVAWLQRYLGESAYLRLIFGYVPTQWWPFSDILSPRSYCPVYDWIGIVFGDGTGLVIS